MLLVVLMMLLGRVPFTYSISSAHGRVPLPSSVHDAIG